MLMASFHMPCTSKAARTISLNTEIQATGQHIHVFKDSAPELTSAPQVAIVSSKTSIAQAYILFSHSKQCSMPADSPPNTITLKHHLIYSTKSMTEGKSRC